ncbi:MAG: polysaccharide deacetylase family protein [Verrucomicrobiota bacterium]
MKKRLIISLHDVHPGTREQVIRQVDALNAVGADRFSLLVVPKFHHEKLISEDPLLLDWLTKRHAQGDDLVLHGYYHDRQGRELGNIFWTKLYTNGEAECLDLSDGEIRHRIEMGRRIWDDHEWKMVGFIPPAWLMPESQYALLRREELLYTNRLRDVTLLLKNRVIRSQSLCYSTRSGWRREISPLWNQWLFTRLRGQSVIRLSLHPPDFEFELIRQQIIELVELALADGYEPVTYAQYAES